MSAADGGGYHREPTTRRSRWRDLLPDDVERPTLTAADLSVSGELSSLPAHRQPRISAIDQEQAAADLT